MAIVNSHSSLSDAWRCVSVRACVTKLRAKVYYKYSEGVRLLCKFVGARVKPWRRCKGDHGFSCAWKRARNPRDSGHFLCRILRG